MRLKLAMALHAGDLPAVLEKCRLVSGRASRRHPLVNTSATGHDMITSSKYVVEADHKPTTVALKLAVVQRRFKAIRWRRLRSSNPAAGVKEPRDRTSRLMPASML